MFDIVRHALQLSLSLEDKIETQCYNQVFLLPLGISLYLSYTFASDYTCRSILLLILYSTLVGGTC